MMGDSRASVPNVVLYYIRYTVQLLPGELQIGYALNND